jgi:hypothetical protein
MGDHSRNRAHPSHPAFEREFGHQRAVSHHPNDFSQHPIRGHSPIAVAGGISLRVRQAKRASERASPEQPVNHVTKDRVPEQHQVPDARAIYLNSLDFGSITDPKPWHHAAARNRQAYAPSAL